MKTMLFAALAGLLLGSPSAAVAADPAPASPSGTTTTPPAASGPRFGAWGVDLSARDLAVRPGQDFNLHANGSYIRSTTIPADKTSVGGFDGLYEQSQAQLLAIVETLAARGGKGEAGLVGALYKSFMDEPRLEKLDDRPLQADLKRIRSATTHEAQARLMGDTHGRAGGSFFVSEVMEDLKDPSRNALYVGQAGLGLPDRDFYFGESFAPVRAAYQAYLGQTLASVGWPNAKAAAADVWALELQVAGVHWTRVEKRQMEKIYNPITLAELEVHAPGFPWRAWAEGAGLAKVSRVIAVEKEAFPKLAGIFAATPIATLQAWQAAQTIDQASPYLSKRFVDQRFAFHGKVLQGQQELRARAKRGVQLVDQQLGDALGRVYVERHFPPSSKARMEALVSDLRTVMTVRLAGLEWMSPATRQQALYKVSRLGVKIGYPNQWRDYSKLGLSPSDLYGNVVAAGKFNRAWMLAKLDRPADPAEWGLTPQTVNAYYNPVRNEIVFPAAILQPPFFDPKADAAVNYGSIGGVIGHEITHGFDDQGRKSDGDGVLRDWWTAEDAARFEARAKALAAQYSAIEVLPGAKVNGALTLGENIADLGGVLLGLDAYRLSLGGRPAPVLDGTTGDQRVLYGWAQVWRSVTREETTRQLLVTDSHTPTAVRARAPVRNVDAWYEAFGVKPGDADYLPPEQRVRIW
jgi:putative endopeptidase